ncbi:MAG: hypothetical protein RBQ94_01560 [Methanimicrococcus sp.]|nr:hypothetical protein [Methanimicrococcus sp.]
MNIYKNVKGVKSIKGGKTGGNGIDTDLSIVAEKRGVLEEYTIFLIPYTDRKDLTPEEKVCIGNYQDVQFWNRQKNDWSFHIPKNWKTKPWCYALNSCCRHLSF